jgi:hypothetical protein
MKGVQQVTGNGVSPLSTRPYEICRQTASSYNHIIAYNNKEFTRQQTFSAELAASYLHIFYSFEKTGKLVSPVTGYSAESLAEKIEHMTDTSFLAHIQKPGRYTGCEYNSITESKDTAEIHCALLFPDLYEIGMSHQGLQILYHILNKDESVHAERCYCPDKDAEALLKKDHLPLCTLESGTPLAEFDMLGFTLPYELCYTNILTMLELAGIPFLSKDRDNTHPLVLGGGACSMNPEPVADFFDAILLGDGEEAILEITKVLYQARRDSTSRDKLLQQLSKVEGIYIPSKYEPEYDQDGRLSTLIDNTGTSSPPTRRVLPDMDRLDHLLSPIVPNAKIVHDRLGVEVARGCTRGCRFCQAGITYRPVRERSPQQVLKLANEGIANSGFDELALLSLSTGDYSCLGEVLPQLMNRFAAIMFLLLCHPCG